jgi:hypothetical protein
VKCEGADIERVWCAAAGYRKDSASGCCIVQCLVCSSVIQTGECVCVPYCAMFFVQQRDTDRRVRVCAVLCNVWCAAAGYRQDNPRECFIVQCFIYKIYFSVPV